MWKCVCALVFCAALAPAQQVINNCGSFTAPGAYIVGADFSVPPGRSNNSNCLDFHDIPSAASLNCNGHTISSSPKDVIAIVSILNSPDFTVTNCKFRFTDVSAASQGVYFSNSPGARIVSNSCANCSIFGDRGSHRSVVSGNTLANGWMFLSGSDYLEISDNRVDISNSAHFFSALIYLMKSSHSTVLRNSGTGSAAVDDGIDLDTVSDVLVQDSVISTGFCTGLEFVGLSDRVRAVNNSFSNYSIAGVGGYYNVGLTNTVISGSRVYQSGPLLLFFYNSRPAGTRAPVSFQNNQFLSNVGINPRPTTIPNRIDFVIDAASGNPLALTAGNNVFAGNDFGPLTPSLTPASMFVDGGANVCTPASYYGFPLSCNGAPPPPVIGFFGTTPSAVSAGQPSTLSWSVSGATSVTIDHGVGDVSALTAKSVSPSQTATYTLTAANSAGSVSAQATLTVQPPAPPPTTGLWFYPVPSCRVMDTRGLPGSLGAPYLAGGASRTIPLRAGPCGIPATAQAYALNIAAIPRTGMLGFLTVWAAGQPRPLGSTLNAVDGLRVANGAIVAAGADGAVSAFATNDTDLAIDVNGYFAPPAPGGLQFHAVTPCRVLDTRNAEGPFGGPSLIAGSSRMLPAPSAPCGIPANAAAYSVNATAVPRGPLAGVTAWATGQPRPMTSTVFSVDGSIVANAAIVAAGTAGAISLFATDATDLVVDINGYYSASAGAGLSFYAVTQCRVADTRNATGPFGSPMLAPVSPRTFPIGSSPCGLPSTASAYALNLTVVPAGPLGFLAAWPAGQAQPLVSTLNDAKALPVANSAVAPAGSGGLITVLATSNTDLVIDAAGYFAP